MYVYYVCIFVYFYKNFLLLMYVCDILYYEYKNTTYYHAERSVDTTV